MRTLRTLLAWYFLLWCMFTTAIVVEFGAYVFTVRDPLLLTTSIGVEIAIIAQAFAFGKAWWLLWREKDSARAWCIAASVISLVLPICALIGLKFSIVWHVAAMWRLAAFISIPIIIGFGGILFALTDSAKTLPHPSHSD